VQLSLRPGGRDRPLQCAGGPAPSARDANALYVPPNGELVLLLNPAFEDSRFANINDLREQTFHPCQVPLLVTLASEADDAVGVAFPAAQRLARPTSKRAEGVGMHQPFLTHRLALRDTSTGGAPILQDRNDDRGCSCPLDFRANGDALISQLLPVYEHLAALAASGAGTLSAADYLSTVLSPLEGVGANIPFMTVQVDRRIVDGHNDIFNSRFLGFVLEFVARTEVKRRSTTDRYSKR
jgi:hypothetical protein